MTFEARKIKLEHNPKAQVHILAEAAKVHLSGSVTYTMIYCVAALGISLIVDATDPFVGVLEQKLTEFVGFFENPDMAAAFIVAMPAYCKDEDIKTAIEIAIEHLKGKYPVLETTRIANIADEVFLMPLGLTKE